MGIWYQDYENNKELKYTNQDQLIKLHSCIQDILTWRGECSFDVERGIDYDSVFAKNSFLVTQLEDILNQYKLFFEKISYDVKPSKDGIIIDITFIFLNPVDGKITYSAKLEKGLLINV